MSPGIYRFTMNLGRLSSSLGQPAGAGRPPGGGGGGGPPPIQQFIRWDFSKPENSGHLLTSGF